MGEQDMERDSRDAAMTGWNAPEDVTFSARYDGSQQAYVRMLPAAVQPPAPRDMLIALHGHGADRWQFAADPRDECRAARDFAVAQGMLYISPDYRARTSWMGPAAEADLLQIIQELKGMYPIARIFLCGASMGGTSALAFATMHPDLIDGVASMNGTANLLAFDNFQDAIRESYGGSKTEIPQVYEARSAELAPDRLTMPIGLAVSGQDSAVPPHSVLRLADKLKAREADVLLIYREELGHVTTYADARAILDFMRTHAGSRTRG